MLIKSAKLRKIYGFSKKHIVLSIQMQDLHKIEICRSRTELLNIKNGLVLDKNISIGFVPTMGALHEGHLALVKRAYLENDLVIVSIFVNPTQFNNPEDLKKYPRTIENDLCLLEKVASCIVFIPEYEDIYIDTETYIPLDLNGLDNVMEGKYRPGHFQGVVHVVHNLFQLVKPTKAYFGKKDFQQLAIIKYMNEQFNFPIEIVGCETVREKNGLAKSSRNLRLSEKEKQDALILFQTLSFMKEKKTKFASPEKLKAKAISRFNNGKLELEYLEIVDAETLEVLTKSWRVNSVACIAAYCGEVRLIDNLEI
jgi:pantoate--beta-alanine ligase